MKCIICREREATVRNRNEAPWGKKKKVCSECHAELLKKDLQKILAKNKKKKEPEHAGFEDNREREHDIHGSSYDRLGS